MAEEWRSGRRRTALLKRRRRSLLRGRLLQSAGYAAAIAAPPTLFLALEYGIAEALIGLALALPGLALAAFAVMQQTRDRLDGLISALTPSAGVPQDLSTPWTHPDDLVASEAQLASLFRGARRSLELSEREVQASLRRAEDASAGVVTLFQRRVRAEEGMLVSLASELHDTVAQSLLTAQWSLEQERDVNEGLEQVRLAEQQLRDVLALARLPEVGVDVASSVRDFVDHLERRFGLVTTIGQWPTEPMDVSSPTAASLYRFYQEALRNVVKHSGQRQAELSLRLRADGMLEARVQDHGVGFSPSDVRPVGGRQIGLLSMDDRARACGGVAHVESSPGAGAVLTLIVPVAVRETR